MFWIMCAVTFFAVSVIAVFLMSCLAIAQQADEQSERAYSILAGEDTAQ